MPGGEEDTFAWPVPGVWTCPDCGSRSWARFDVPKRGGGYMKGEGVRCINCKREHYPDARATAAPASGVELAGAIERAQQAIRSLSNMGRKINGIEAKVAVYENDLRALISAARLAASPKAQGSDAGLRVDGGQRSAAWLGAQLLRTQGHYLEAAAVEEIMRAYDLAPAASRTGQKG